MKLLLFLLSGAGTGKVLGAEWPRELNDGCADVFPSKALLDTMDVGPGGGVGVGERVGSWCSSLESNSTSDGRVGEGISSRGASCRDSTAPAPALDGFWADAMSSY